MRRETFFDALRTKLSVLPKEELEERISFLSEMIDDRMEEGCTEEEAVAGIGTVDEVVGRILAEVPLVTLVKQRMRPERRVKPWEILLLVLGAPLWIPLLAAALVLWLAAYIVLWSLVISLWAVEISLVACGFAGAIAGGAMLVLGRWFPGGGLVSLGCVSAGLSIFLFFGCKAATQQAAHLTAGSILWIKHRLVGKGREDA